MGNWERMGFGIGDLHGRAQSRNGLALWVAFIYFKQSMEFSVGSQ